MSLRFFSMIMMVVILGMSVAVEAKTIVVPGYQPIHMRLVQSDIVVIADAIRFEEGFTRDGVDYTLAVLDVVETLKGDKKTTQVKVAFPSPEQKKDEADGDGKPNQPVIGIARPLPAQIGAGGQWQPRRVSTTTIEIGVSGVWPLVKDAERDVYWITGRPAMYTLQQTEQIEKMLKVFADIKWTEPVNGISFAMVGQVIYGNYDRKTRSQILSIRIYMLAKNVSDKPIYMPSLMLAKSFQASAKSKAGNEIKNLKLNRHQNLPQNMNVQRRHFRELQPGEIAGVPYPHSTFTLPEPTKQGTWTVNVTYQSQLDAKGEDNQGKFHFKNVWKGKVNFLPVTVEMTEKALQANASGSGAGQVRTLRMQLPE